MENQTELKWYQKPAGVIILLIFFFPVGLYLMWKNELWTKQTRWIVTGVLALIVIANAGNDKNGNSSYYENTSYLKNDIENGVISETIIYENLEIINDLPKKDQILEDNLKKEFNKHSAEIKIDEWINIVKKNCTEEGFEYKDIKDYQRTADFNGDGLVDYLLWEGGVICDGRTGGYFGNAGPHITFLISSGNGYNFHEGFSFFELSELPISKENGLDIIIIEGTQYGKPIKVKWKWNGNTIKIQN